MRVKTSELTPVQINWVVANTYEELQEGMEICAPVVQAWIDEFKVNDMGGKR